MAAVEGLRGLQQNKLTSLVGTSRFDFKDSSKWIFRYHKDSRAHWNKRADQLVDAVMTDTDNALQDFVYASPKTKLELIELSSNFGLKMELLRVATSSRLIANAMLQYSNPDGISVAEQFDFFTGGILYIKPKMFFGGLNLYFYEQRQSEFLEKGVKINKMRRREEFPDKDPCCESAFIRKNANKALSDSGEKEKQEFMRSYEHNRDMYELLGLRYDGEQGKFIHIIPVSDPAETVL